jgi:splicing factor 3B subunit 1
MVAPLWKLMATPITEVGGFQIQDGSDAGLALDLPTKIPGVGNLPFFKAEDTQYFAKILKEEDKTELSVDEM